MNIALTINNEDQAMLLYDEPLGFSPAWIEFQDDKSGIRIMSDEGHEFTAGPLLPEVTARLGNVNDILLVRMANNAPVEGHEISFVKQSY